MTGNGFRFPEGFVDDVRARIRAARLMMPAGTKRLIPLADADNADPPLAEALLRRASTRFVGMGLTVSIARPEEGYDFNSMLDAKAPAEAGA